MTTTQKPVVHTYPAPKQLATVTDLKPDEVRQITEAINPIVADFFALYVKTKNFHWHVASSHFREYHKLFDQQAEQIFKGIDILAERIRKVGGTTVRSISHISQMQTIRDDNGEFVPPGDMLRRLMEDNEQLAKEQRAAHEVCEKCRDVATTSELEMLIDQTERRKWFLFETLQGAHNAD